MTDPRIPHISEEEWAKLEAAQAEKDKRYEAEIDKCAVLLRRGERPAIGTPLEIAYDAWIIVSQEQRQEVLALRAEVDELKERLNSHEYGCAAEDE